MNIDFIKKRDSLVVKGSDLVDGDIVYSPYIQHDDEHCFEYNAKIHGQFANNGFPFFKLWDKSQDIQKIIDKEENLFTTQQDIINASTESDELLQCPLCGTSAYSYGKKNPVTGNTVYHVQCHNVHTCGCSVHYCSEDPLKARENAVQRWNKRT